MTQIAKLHNRRVLAITGSDAADFLDRVISQRVGDMTPDELRLGLLLSPQGRFMFDLFFYRTNDGFLADVNAETTAALVKRLTMYTLGADVKIEIQEKLNVYAAWDGQVENDAQPDPRLGDLGWRWLADGAVENANLDDYRRHQMKLGAPDLTQDLDDKTYPIDANLDVLNAIDFQKGCFVGQEVTSRMKRNGTIKTRMLPFTHTGQAKAADIITNSDGLRAGTVTSALGNMGIAKLRLDRRTMDMTANDHQITVTVPNWLKGHVDG